MKQRKNILAGTGAQGAAVTLPLTEEPAMLTYWTTVSPMYYDYLTIYIKWCGTCAYRDGSGVKIT